MGPVVREALNRRSLPQGWRTLYAREADPELRQQLLIRILPLKL